MNTYKSPNKEEHWPVTNFSACFNFHYRSCASAVEHVTCPRDILGSGSAAASTNLGAVLTAKAPTRLGSVLYGSGLSGAGSDFFMHSICMYLMPTL